MNHLRSTVVLLFLSSLIGCVSLPVEKSAYLYKVSKITSDGSDKCGYINAAGDTIIALGKYQYCFTDTLKNFAVVMADNGNLIAVNKNDRKLFEVFKYDNGPDYLSDGLFRVIDEGKIGYANAKGKMVIQPQFYCAYPFKEGRAKVSKKCKTKIDGEHIQWQSTVWFFIDKHGDVVK